MHLVAFSVETFHTCPFLKDKREIVKKASIFSPIPDAVQTQIVETHTVLRRGSSLKWSCVKRSGRTVTQMYSLTCFYSIKRSTRMLFPQYSVKGKLMDCNVLNSFCSFSENCFLFSRVSDRKNKVYPLVMNGLNCHRDC